MVPLVLIAVVNMLFCRDLTPSLAPFLFISTAFAGAWATNTQDYAIFFPLVPIVVGAFAFHFVLWPPKFQVGKMYYSLIGVSVALLLGGIGVTTAEEYFAGINLFFLIGLGPALILLYFIFLNTTVADENHDPAVTIPRIMCYFGLACAGVLALSIWPRFTGNWNWFFSWRNNLATFLLLCIPFPFYLAVKQKSLILSALQFLLGCFFVAATVLTLSRGGIIFGLVTAGLCFAYAVWKADGKRKRILFCALTVAVIVAGLIVLLPNLRTRFGSGITSPDEARYGLFRHAWEMFLAHPVFGRGLGYWGPLEYFSPNEDLTMYWYHNTVLQVLGSLGIVGAIAYIYQYINRATTCLGRKPNNYSWCVFLSWGAFSMMAMVNAGDFMPVPDAIIVVLLLTTAELKNRQQCPRCEQLPSGVRL